MATVDYDYHAPILDDCYQRMIPGYRNGLRLPLSPYTLDTVEVGMTSTSGSELVKTKYKRERHVVVPISRSLFPYPGFVGWKVQLGDRSFRLMNVGGFQEHLDDALIDYALMAAEPWSHAEIELVGESAKNRAGAILHRYSRSCQQYPPIL